jgi:sugar-phosphatase
VAGEAVEAEAVETDDVGVAAGATVGDAAGFDVHDVAAVLLDMDGTLVDSDAAVERAWATWASEHGVDPEEAVGIAHGHPADVTVRALLPDLAPPEVAAAAARQLALQYDDLADVVATAGVDRLVGVLTERGLPWAVVTSADRRLARARLTAAGIDPPVLVTEEDVRAGKPDPEGYLAAAQALGVAPTRCLVVEDSAPGLLAGRAAGARTAALKGLDGDLRLADVGQLAALLSDP